MFAWRATELLGRGAEFIPLGYTTRAPHAHLHRTTI